MSCRVYFIDNDLLHTAVSNLYLIYPLKEIDLPVKGVLYLFIIMVFLCLFVIIVVIVK